MTRSMPRFALAHLSDEAVAAYADGVLSSGPQSRADHHLAECPDCAGAVREQQQARSALRSAPAPTVPCSLLERLRQLPISAPLGEQSIAAMSVDGRAVFAAYDSRRPPTDFRFLSAIGTAPVGTATISTAPIGTAPIGTTTIGTATISGSAPHHRRRVVPGLGLSAAAAATLIVGVMATTAVTEGGAGSAVAHPVVNSPAVPASVRPAGNTTPIVELIAPR